MATLHIWSNLPHAISGIRTHLKTDLFDSSCIIPSTTYAVSKIRRVEVCFFRIMASYKLDLNELSRFRYNYSFNSSVLPAIWLHAYITPIFKKDDSTSPANYRPISLTCTTCKIVESIIKDAMSSALLTANLITKQQHAFISKHSTTSNLLECRPTSDWS